MYSRYTPYLDIGATSHPLPVRRDWVPWRRLGETPLHSLLAVEESGAATCPQIPFHAAWPSKNGSLLVDKLVECLDLGGSFDMYCVRRAGCSTALTEVGYF